MRFRPFAAVRQRIILYVSVPTIVALTLFTMIRPVSAQTLTLMQDRTQTLSGFSFNIAWETAGVSSCAVSHTKPDGSVVSNWGAGTSGSQTATPMQRGSHHWTLTCDGNFQADIQHVITPVMVFSPNS
jgi:hypothetical protein